jgi:SAM-dependent methyltransferase
VTALEPDSSVVVGRGAIQQLARESALPIQALEGFAEQVPAQDETYDLVYGRQVMHHAHDLQTMCNEIFRVLKPGGIFIATREHVISQREDLSVFLEHHALHHLYGGENAYLLDEYLGAIRSSGLKALELLGSYDSIINYFPRTETQILKQLHSPFTKYLGVSLTRALLYEKLPWTNFINNLLAKRASRQDSSPGRLYTFICEKTV